VLLGGNALASGEPNRDVVVTGIRYQVDSLGFTAIVYVSDADGP
jgi:hypothetical protein